mmetsp:Transcript_9951/g.21365  ORF Transcript_9951/g.21365 Transcript_9951/m.21365 type:complete len:275 (+) Transcript_9951:242-1066(+)
MGETLCGITIRIGTGTTTRDHKTSRRMGKTSSGQQWQRQRSGHQQNRAQNHGVFRSDRYYPDLPATESHSEMARRPNDSVAADHGNPGARGRRKIHAHGTNTGADEPDLQAGSGQAMWKRWKQQQQRKATSNPAELAAGRERIGTGPGGDHGNRDQNNPGAQARHRGAGCSRAPRFYTGDDHGCRERGCCRPGDCSGHGRIRSGIHGRRPNQGTHHAGQGLGRHADHRCRQQTRRGGLERGPVPRNTNPGEGVLAQATIQTKTDTVCSDFRFDR